MALRVTCALEALSILFGDAIGRGDLVVGADPGARPCRGCAGHRQKKANQQVHTPSFRSRDSPRHSRSRFSTRISSTLFSYFCVSPAVWGVISTLPNSQSG